MGLGWSPLARSEFKPHIPDYGTTYTLRIVGLGGLTCGSGVGVQALGFRGQDFGSRVEGLGLRASGSGFTGYRSNIGGWW